MAGVETRRGPFVTLLKNHFFSAIVSFVLVLTAFKWLFAMDTGIIVLFSLTAAVHMAYGVYSYTYYQAKVDKRDTGNYNFLSPLKTGLISSALIIIPALFHIFLVNVFPVAGELFGLFARLWNYPFFWFFYGREGTWYNYTAMAIATVIPVVVAYMAYFLGIKRFSFAEKLNILFYKKGQ